MEMWFSDIHTDGVKLSIRIEEQLFSSQSEVQRIDVLESKDFGKILVVDGDLIAVQIFLHIIIQAAHLLIAQVGHRIKLAVSKGDIDPSRLRARSG